MRAALALLLMLSACGPPPPRANDPRDIASAPKPDVSRLQLKAADGVVVHGTLYRAPKPKALILLFHQAGSSKGEYASIAPQLVATGYSALAIDQRAGGNLYGANETAPAPGKAAATGEGAQYLSARPDLQAALDWAETQDLPIILWGSSYSASLIFTLAAQHPAKVKALLSFSPGEYFDDGHLIARAAAKIAVPAFVTTAGSAEEIVAARPIVDAIPAGLATIYVPKSGVHGSSTLIAPKNPAGVDANWAAVKAFLAKQAP